MPEARKREVSVDTFPVARVTTAPLDAYRSNRLLAGDADHGLAMLADVEASLDKRGEDVLKDGRSKSSSLEGTSSAADGDGLASSIRALAGHRQDAAWRPRTGRAKTPFFEVCFAKKIAVPLSSALRDVASALP